MQWRRRNSNPVGKRGAGMDRYVSLRGRMPASPRLGHDMKVDPAPGMDLGGSTGCSALRRLGDLVSLIMKEGSAVGDRGGPASLALRLEPPFRAAPETLVAFAASLEVAGDVILRVVQRAAESTCAGAGIRRTAILASLDTYEWRYEYDDKGRRKSAAKVDRRSGRVLEVTSYYYFLDRLSWEETSAGGRVMRQVHYEYDREGKLRSWILHEVEYDGDTPVRIREYEYDAQDRLLRERVHEIPRER